ncbi:glycosyltransferase family 2 protein [Yoonia sp. SS1-5]|uniref:Glycosyltransferase family 2 protein n=1 Tax=Yoonia rhodophyticola TaxID=3137370 RepID=A0AAN0NJR6_9RHOB
MPKPQLSLWAAAARAYRLRWKRRRLLFRILRKRHEIRPAADRTHLIRPGAVLAFCCVHNEALRLPYFLAHYRALGVAHFLFVDNSSDDDTAALLRDQPDVSLWQTDASYRLARFGMDWLGWLHLRFGHGHWCLTVDADELLIYPEHDTRGLPDLADWLSRQGRRSFGALMLDMCPKGAVTQSDVDAGTNPLDAIPYFDATHYRSRWHPAYGNLWIQGGVRERVFFGPAPERAPTLNKTPFVYWNRRFAYVSSTHQIVPPRLHDVFAPPGQNRMTGVLLHTKFLPDIAERSREAISRRQHFENSALYDSYYRSLMQGPDLWNPQSRRYEDWRQLVDLGLMCREEWV